MAEENPHPPPHDYRHRARNQRPALPPSGLPVGDDLFSHMSRYLPVEDHLRARSVSHGWQDRLNDPNTWANPQTHEIVFPLHGSDGEEIRRIPPAALQKIPFTEVNISRTTLVRQVLQGINPRYVRKLVVDVLNRENTRALLQHFQNSPLQYLGLNLSVVRGGVDEEILRLIPFNIQELQIDSLGNNLRFLDHLTNLRKVKLWNLYYSNFPTSWRQTVESLTVNNLFQAYVDFPVLHTLHYTVRGVNFGAPEGNILAQLHQLDHLTISSVSCSTFIRYLPRQLLSLHIIDGYVCNLNEILEQCPRLQKVTLENCELALLVEIDATKTSLQEIGLFSMDRGAIGYTLSRLGRYSRMNRLRTDCYNVMMSLPRLNHLTHVYYTVENVEDLVEGMRPIVQNLRRHPNLQHVELEFPVQSEWNLTTDASQNKTMIFDSPEAIQNMGLPKLQFAEKDF